jgi:hypothetical protein
MQKAAYPAQFTKLPFPLTIMESSATPEDERDYRVEGSASLSMLATIADSPPLPVREIALGRQDSPRYAPASTPETGVDCIAPHTGKIR